MKLAIPDSLLAINPHLAGDATPARGARRVSALDAQRLAGCPPSEREALARETGARSHHVAQGKAAHVAGAALEGVIAAESAVKMARKYDVSMPICHAVYRILYEDATVDEVMKTLLERPFSVEGISG